MKKGLIAVISAILTFAHYSPGTASERVALVVGNGDYAVASKLANPVNDAKAVERALQRLDFKIISLSDAGIDEFYDGIERFKREAAAARVGLFYFAGHGVEVEDQNYLMPVDAELSQSSHLRTQAISLAMIIREMEDARIPAKMLILDCCRDNPLTRSWMRTRSAGKGLALISDNDIPPATMILFAAGPGETALDGEGENSPFTSALVTQLGKPGLNAMEAFYSVSDTVVETTGKRQEPWVKVDGAGRAFREFSLAIGGSDKPSLDVTVAPVAPIAPPMTDTTDVPAPPSMLDTSRNATPGLRVVPDQYATIQEAVDNAIQDDVILIKPGIYYEMLSIPDIDGIELRGESRESVILRVPKTAALGSIIGISSYHAEGLRIANISFEFADAPSDPTRELPDITDSHIEVNGGSVEIENCKFDGSRHIYGVRIIKGEGVVRHCEMDQCVLGIQVCNDGTVGRLYDNTVRNSVYMGIIGGFGGDIVAERNTVTGSGTNGFQIQGETTTAVFRSNTAENNTLNGFELSYGFTGTVEKNRSINNSAAGIVLFNQGTSPLVSENHCEGNKSSGISLNDFCGGNIVQNVCNKNFIGISLVTGSSPVLRKNRCEHNQASGITAEGGECKPSFIDNISNNNGEYGMAIAAECYPAEFSGNTATGNKFDQINRSATFIAN